MTTVTAPSTSGLGGGAALLSLALLALALLVGGPPTGRLRLLELGAAPARPAGPVPVLRPYWAAVGALAMGALGWAFGGPGAGVVLGGATAAILVVALRRMARPAPQESDAELAGRWELLAVCLDAGLPVAAAVSAAAAPLRGSAGILLRRVAGLLELGADAAEAWHGAEELPALAAFARAAGRSAGTGAALAQVAAAESTRLRAGLVDTAQARAQRAAVLITAPLGLCFLPAFLVLGIAPVVIGLAGRALAQW
ncbi:type II secretion system F family protein [Pseudonocardia sp. GCM10023141]|uniref:type II secretion system F family protein n=1 Tax=Pseudonocardia sp. GCM10023141 TaxID=3252653 RepID=UPI00361A0D6D